MSQLRALVLHPPELERRYRAEHLPMDMRQMRRILGIVVGVTLIFALTDRQFGGDLYTVSVNVTRTLIVGGAGLVALLMWKGVSVRGYDRAVFIWVTVVAVDLVLVNAARPTLHSLNAVLDVMAVITVHVVVPAPLISKVVPSLIGTVGYAVLYLRSPLPVEPVEAVVIAACFAMANAFGTMGSVRAHRTSRKQFLALVGEQEARAALEKAIAEIRTLRGIIPICSGCRKVRSDSGFWEQVEEYVGRHTDASFSHGLCPDCSAELYPEYQPTR